MDRLLQFGSDKLNINVWAKGGYGLNEPGRYAVVYKENGVTPNNIYSNMAGENKNGMAYSAGAGIKLAISEFVGLQLSAGYFGTKTDQINYNFDREKGTAPLYYTANNQFIQASAGLQFSIGNGSKHNTSAVDTGNPTSARMDQKIKTKSNIKNDFVIIPDDDIPSSARMDQKIKTKSNIKNDRMANNAGTNTDDNTDSLLFSPQKIELRSRVADDGSSRTQLQSVDNFLTGFVYQSQNGAMISQCGASAMPGDPIPGLDVKLKRIGGLGNDVLSTRTNKDGSFAFNNIAPGNYTAEAGKSLMDVTVNGNADNALKTLDVFGGSCGSTKENFVISAGDKTYVEVIAAREAGSGMASGRRIGKVKYEDIKALAPRDAASGLATGKRMHKPYRVADTEFEMNPDNIVSNDGKYYAEVITSREAGSGMATGRRSMVVTGDVDGDGLDDNAIVSPRDAASGLPTGRRMHKPYVITKELDASNYEIVSPRDLASGQATGRVLPTVNKKNEIAIDEPGVQVSIVSPRDAASGLPTGKRMHKPFIIHINDDDDLNYILSPRDAASGMPTGRRQYQPLVIRIDPVENSYEVVSPRDAASGLPTGKRMHKPFVITKELDFNDDGDEVVTYKIIHRDLAARNVLLDDADEQKMAITEIGVPGNNQHKKGIITGKDNDNGMYADRDAASGMATGKRMRTRIDELETRSWDDEEIDMVSNPLYTADGNVGTNPLYQENSIQNNPLYQGGDTKGVNPLFEAKSTLRVMGSNGKAHDIFIPARITVTPVNNPPTEFTSYDVNAIRWMAPESISSKGITEKGIKLSQDKAEANSERKGWDGTVKGGSKNINTSEDNLGNGITKDGTVNNAARKGWDGTVKGGSKKINTSEDNIGTGSPAKKVTVRGWDPTTKGAVVVKEINRVRCADGTCSIEAIVEADGAEYEAVITGILKTKHDTVKNSINNVR